MSGGGVTVKRGVRPHTMVRVLLAAAAVAALAACSSDNMSDLRAYVQAEKAKPGGRVEPIPEVKPFESFIYKEASRRSPFEPWTTTAAASPRQLVAGSGPAPDSSRRREALESFPLDTLRMVGTLERKDGVWAVVKAPDGLVYRVARNNYLGQNHGRITRVTEDKVEVVEIVPDGLGGWQERQASLALAE